MLAPTATSSTIPLLLVNYLSADPVCVYVCGICVDAQEWEQRRERFFQRVDVLNRLHRLLRYKEQEAAIQRAAVERAAPGPQRTLRLQQLARSEAAGGGEEVRRWSAAYNVLQAEIRSEKAALYAWPRGLNPEERQALGISDRTLGAFCPRC